MSDRETALRKLAEMLDEEFAAIDRLEALKKSLPPTTAEAVSQSRLDAAGVTPEFLAQLSAETTRKALAKKPPESGG